MASGHTTPAEHLLRVTIEEALREARRDAACYAHLAEASVQLSPAVAQDSRVAWTRLWAEREVEVEVLTRLLERIDGPDPVDLAKRSEWSETEMRLAWGDR